MSELKARELKPQLDICDPDFWDKFWALGPKNICPDCGATYDSRWGHVRCEPNRRGEDNE